MNETFTAILILLLIVVLVRKGPNLWVNLLEFLGQFF